MGQATGILPQEQPAWAGIFTIGIFAGTLLGYTFLTIVSLRSDVYTRTADYLLLAQPAIFALMLVRLAITGGTGTAVGGFVLGTARALTTLALGFVLREEPQLPEQAERSSEPRMACAYTGMIRAARPGPL